MVTVEQPSAPTATRVGSRLAGPGAVLFVGMSVANVSNYLFQVVVSRLQGPAAYGLLGSVLAFANVLAISLMALQAGSAKSIAEGTARGELRRVTDDPLTRATLKYGALVAVATAAASPLLAGFLHDGVGPGLALALYVIPAALFAIGQGRLQGAQAFMALAVLNVAVAFGRIIAGPAAVLAGGGTTGVVVATSLVTAAVAWWALHRTRYAGAVAPRVIGGDVVRAAVSLGLLWLMVSADIPVARHFLDPELAGQYAVASVLGKAVLWLPVAFAVIMFPRVARRRQAGEDPRGLLLAAFAISAGLCVAGVLGLLLLGTAVIPVFFGSGYAQAAGFAWKVGMACVPFALANLLIYYHLTRGSARFITAIAVAALAEAVGFVFFHDSVDMVVEVIGASGVVLALGLGLPGTLRYLLRRGR